MGRRRTTEEYNRTAEKNGWVLVAYAEEDGIQLTKDEPVKRYTQNQQAALDQWVIFRGLLASEYLRKDCPVLSNVLLKDFAQWYCSSRSGRLAPKPNLNSVNDSLKKFFCGFQRVTGTEISEELRKDVYLSVRNKLLRQGYTAMVKRDKLLFDVDDLVNVLDSLWQHWHDHDRA